VAFQLLKMKIIRQTRIQQGRIQQTGGLTVGELLLVLLVVAVAVGGTSLFLLKFSGSSKAPTPPPAVNRPAQ
jgi:hypothetical protein